MRRFFAGLLLSGGLSLGAVGAPPAGPVGPKASAVRSEAAWTLPATLAVDLPPRSAAGGDAAWRVHGSDHFRVVHRGDPVRAATQATLLETTYRRFFDIFEGFGVTPVQEPMTCLFFESKDDYLQYAERVDRVDMSWTVAYYSANTNRIAFYRYGPGPVAEDRGGRVAEADAEPLYVSASTGAGTGGSPADGWGWRGNHRISLASATHEAAHQLAFNAGLQRRGVRYPLWVSEGVATNFEMVGDAGAVGPDQDNPGRRRRLARLLEDGLLMPLERFIAVTHPPTRDARATDAMYAQAWGLFRFLYHEHRAELSLYLADLYALPAGGRDESVLRREFELRFGPVEQIERQWRKHIEEDGGH